MSKWKNINEIDERRQCNVWKVIHGIDRIVRAIFELWIQISLSLALSPSKIHIFRYFLSFCFHNLYFELGRVMRVLTIFLSKYESEDGAKTPPTTVLTNGAARSLLCADLPDQREKSVIDELPQSRRSFVERTTHLICQCFTFIGCNLCFIFKKLAI